MPTLPERTVNFMLRSLRRNLAPPWCQKLLNRFELPPTVQHHARYRVSIAVGMNMNIWSEKSVERSADRAFRSAVVLEKSRGPGDGVRATSLTYMPNNPAKRGLVSQPGEWPW